MNDLRFAIRQFLKDPGFTAVAVLTLALGIGANTAIFSVLNGVLLRPLPFHDSDRLTWVFQSKPQREWLQWPMGTHRFEFWRDHSRSFEQLAMAGPVDFPFAGTTGPEVLRGLTVTANLCDLLGMRPALGRSFRPEETLPGSPAVVMLSHRLWQQRFGGDPDIVGKAIQQRGQSITIVGVLPRELRFPIGTMPAWRVISESEPDVWLPVKFQPPGAPETDLGFVLGRLKPGVTRDQAQAEMESVTGRYETEYPRVEGWSVDVVPMREQVSGRVQPALLLLFGAVAAVLLIACVNVAHLLLARTVQRQREFAIRAAIGAGPSRMARQLLTESLLLSLLGGGLGTLLAFLSLKVLKGPASIPLPRLDEIGIDGRVLVFTLGVSILVGLLFGLAPLWRVSQLAFGRSMPGGHLLAGGMPRSGRMRGTLVAGQAALSFVLLIAAGLLVQSFANVLGTQTGYRPENLLVMNLSLDSPALPTGPARDAAVKELLARVESLPDVVAAGFSFGAPLAQGVPIRKVFRVDDRADMPGEDDTDRIRLRIVSSNYFAVMEIPLLRGRGFSANSRVADGERQEVLVNQSAARLAFPDGDPIGRLSSFGPIVGVVADTVEVALDKPPEPQFYIEGYSAAEAFLVVRTAIPPGALAAAVIREVGAVHKDLAVANVRTLGRRMSDSLDGRRFQMLLLTLFSIVALLLTAVGIAGVVGWSVSRRRSEIGLRMALGAVRSDVFQMILREGLTPVILGMVAGALAALAGTRLLESQLFGVTATDPATFATISLMLLAIAALACWLPARRATLTNPMEALRCE